MTQRKSTHRRNPRRAPDFDLVLFGATSFVGQLLAAELLERQPPGAPGSLRFALAGRSAAKLAQVRATLGPAASGLELLVADAGDATALADLCARTRAVVSTVGPYALHGEPLLKACAEAGTDYCDLTGEAQWIRRMLDRHEGTARRSGARIVHSCGFDSVPSDLGLQFLQQHAVARYGQPCTAVQMRVRRLRGGLSGGTAGSILNIAREALADPAVRRGLADPYWLAPPAPDGVQRPRQRDQRGPRFDADFASWTAPFVMSGINTRIVQRSHALAGYPYGIGFRYDEASLTGPGLAGRLRAMAFSAGLLGFLAGAALPPSRWLLERLVLPAAGEGPSPEQQRTGGWELHFHGRTAAAQVIRTRVSGERDPGYGSTARMLAEAAASLVKDVPVDRRRQPGGFWTPATLLGDALLARLQQHAAVRFEVLPDPASA